MKRQARELPETYNRSASCDSFVISESKVYKRYSALYEALMARDDPAGDTEAAAEPLGNGLAERCREILGRHHEDEKYVIRRRFTQGGMGALYYVDDRDFRRQCVMKVMMPELRDNDLMVSNFVREARITGQLEHPNVIPVHDLGYHPEYGLYFTMKLIGGETLNDILYSLESGNGEHHERHDLGALLNIFRKVCDAVSFAHSRGIVHCDIKPGNIMVGDYGEVYLMDWGLARRMPGEGAAWEPDAMDELEKNEGDESRRTIKGSPGYMSPEQARGRSRALDQRSDIFLLGATLYQLVTWYPPYMGEDVKAILLRARHCDYVAAETMAPPYTPVPKELFRIIQKAMARLPRDRYQSVNDFCTDLDDLIHGRMKFEERRFQPGELLAREGEIGHESYSILQGEVEVYKERQGGIVRLGVLGTGEIVGEMSVITHQPRTASVKALTTTTALVITEDRLQHNLQKLPVWMAKMVKTLATRLSQADERLANLLDSTDT